LDRQERDDTMAMTGQRSVDERNGEKNGDRIAERTQAERG
jgi:hypothetical protein